jgi:hypothetical protein
VSNKLNQEQHPVQLVISVTNTHRKAGELAMWTVYDKPRDYPEHYVARCFRVRGGANPTEHVILTKSLRQLRMVLHSAGLTCLSRSDQDDAKIVETWF